MDIPEDDVPFVLKALTHYADYLKATKRDGQEFLALAERLQRKPAVSEAGNKAKAGKRQA